MIIEEKRSATINFEIAELEALKAVENIIRVLRDLGMDYVCEEGSEWVDSDEFDRITNILYWLRTNSGELHE